MKTEQQRIAIAEACGWKTEFVSAKGGEDGDVWISTNGDCHEELPDYLNDLNAMHEAEKVITWGQSKNYWEHLLRIVSRDIKRPASEHSKDTFAFMSTADQRAEAFLKTLNLWIP